MITHNTLCFLQKFYPSMIVLCTALDIEEYFKLELLLKPETLGKMIHILEDNEDKFLRSRYLLKNSDFTVEYHQNLSYIFEKLLRFVDYQNDMFYYNNIIEKYKI